LSLHFTDELGNSDRDRQRPATRKPSGEFTALTIPATTGSERYTVRYSDPVLYKGFILLGARMHCSQHSEAVGMDQVTRFGHQCAVLVMRSTRVSSKPPKPHGADRWLRVLSWSVEASTMQQRRKRLPNAVLWRLSRLWKETTSVPT